MNLILLGTEHCHLCEQAYELTQLVITMHYQYKDQLNIYKIDILGDTKLYDTYALKIPVLQLTLQNHTDELCWPFKKVDIENLISRCPDC